MKRYERMSKEEIIDFFSKGNSCDGCPQEGAQYCNGNCVGNKAKYLHEESELVPRYKTFETDEDVRRSMSEFSVECFKTDCSLCRFRDDDDESCRTKYLLEEVAKA